MPDLPRPLTHAAAFLALAWPAVGCEPADTRMADLERKVAQLEVEQAKLGLELKHQAARAEAAEAQLAALNKLPPDRWQLLPKPANIALSGYSGLRRGAVQLAEMPATQPAAGRPVGLFARLYLVVTDDAGYRIRAAGPARIALFDLSGEQPRSLGAYEFDAPAMLKHYRSGLVPNDNFFAFDLPLNGAPGRDGVTARVEFSDWMTGRTFTAQRLLELPKD